MTFDKIDFGRALNYWMREKKVTARQLASQLDVSPANISAQKKQKHINTKVLETYMGALGINSIDRFYECR